MKTLGNLYPHMADVIARRIAQKHVPDEAQEHGMALIRNFIRFGELANSLDVDTVDMVLDVGH